MRPDELVQALGRLCHRGISTSHGGQPKDHLELGCEAHFLPDYL